MKWCPASIAVAVNTELHIVLTKAPAIEVKARAPEMLELYPTTAPDRYLNACTPKYQFLLNL